MNSIKTLIAAAAVAASCAAPMLCRADSTTVTPAATNSTASSHLNVSIVVPAVLYLRIGTGSAIGAANNASIDGLTFNVPTTSLGDGTSVAATASSGDLTNGAVTVRVYSNVGTNVTLNSSVTGQPSDGSGDTIPWSQLQVTTAALASGTPGFTNAAITFPALSATSGAGTATTLTATGKLVRNEGMWTFAYKNANTVPAGTYGATTANNGQITFNAVQL